MQSQIHGGLARRYGSGSVLLGAFVRTVKHGWRSASMTKSLVTQHNSESKESHPARTNTSSHSLTLPPHHPAQPESHIRYSTNLQTPNPPFLLQTVTTSTPPKTQSLKNTLTPPYPPHPLSHLFLLKKPSHHLSPLSPSPPSSLYPNLFHKPSYLPLKPNIIQHQTSLHSYSQGIIETTPSTKLE